MELHLAVRVALAMESMCRQYTSDSSLPDQAPTHYFKSFGSHLSRNLRRMQ